MDADRILFDLTSDYYNRIVMKYPVVKAIGIKVDGAIHECIYYYDEKDIPGEFNGLIILDVLPGDQKESSLSNGILSCDICSTGYNASELQTNEFRCIYKETDGSTCTGMPTPIIDINGDIYNCIVLRYDEEIMGRQKINPPGIVTIVTNGVIENLSYPMAAALVSKALVQIDPRHTSLFDKVN